MTRGDPLPTTALPQHRERTGSDASQSDSVFFGFGSYSFMPQEEEIKSPVVRAVLESVLLVGWIGAIVMALVRIGTVGAG